MLEVRFLSWPLTKSTSLKFSSPPVTGQLHVLWKNDSFGVSDDNRCVHHLSHSFPFIYFSLVFFALGSPKSDLWELF